MTGLFIAIGIVGAVALFFVSIFNRLVGLRNAIKNGFAQIDVQLKRRYDLIPNLVETAKGYLKHERETLEAVIAARNQAMSATKAVAADPTNSRAMRDLVAADSSLTGSLGRFMALAESYPDLKADHTMAKLMEELTSTENRVAFARQAYNDAVMRYNNAREMFPSSLIAGTFGFAGAEPFEVTDPAERAAVRVSF